MGIFSASYRRAGDDDVKNQDDIIFYKIYPDKNDIEDMLRDIHRIGISEIPFLVHDYCERITISEEEPNFCNYNKLKDKKDDTKKFDNILLLGEYIEDDDRIVLYYKNIDKVAKDAPKGKCESPLLSVMRYVYLHELMHKFFSRNNTESAKLDYIPEIEEPLAEFGALLCLKKLVDLGKASQEELDWAISSVKSKDSAIKYYSYGAALYENYLTHTDLYKILESYC